VKKLNSTWLELESLNIKIQKYGDIFSLNYCQINSPKFHPIADICRGLIVNNNLEIISQSFDRFYNYGEVESREIFSKPSNFKVVEKIDGSLIKIYWWDNQWNISTRSNPFGDNYVGDYLFTYAELVKSTLGVSLSNLSLDKDYTHIFEIVSPYNKIVTDYGKNPKLYYLVSRNNISGEYSNFSLSIKNNFPLICSPEIYNFNSLTEVLEKSKTLCSLQEGFVIYNNNFQPILKIKSPKYVTAHKLRGNGLTLKNAIQLILDNEQSEYISYFPEDNSFFEKIILEINQFLSTLQNIINHLDYQLSQKDFASLINNYPAEYKTYLFLSRKLNILDARELFFSKFLGKNKIISLLREKIQFL
jgi:hypothetical protein